MKILVLNAGSSSIKYSLFDMQDYQVLASGVIEQIGGSQSLHKYNVLDAVHGKREQLDRQTVVDHQQGLAAIMQMMDQSVVLKHASELYGIGHRVVHGGALFHQPTLIDDAVLANIKKMIPLAPLHNPANLLGIDVTRRFAGDIPQVAVFDTAFHQTLPAYAFRYALPKALYQQQSIRRYGFHGVSHGYVAKQAAVFLQKPLNSLNLITLHLGNGASVTAIQQGKSIDTSMGMTPLEGLIMGTRSGDIDPAIPYFLNANCAMSNAEIDILLNKESGLKGVCGENDMRTIHKMAEAGNSDAQLALDMFCYRIKKYIGAYCAVLGRVDALVFTGGIGENDVQVREKICEGLGIMRITLDAVKNVQRASGILEINQERDAVSILVIPTNEELEIAVQSAECIDKMR